MDKTLVEYLAAAKDEVVEFCKRCRTTHRGPCAAVAMTFTMLVGIPFAQAMKDGTPQPKLEWTMPSSGSTASTHLELVVQDPILDVSHSAPAPFVWYTIAGKPGELVGPLAQPAPRERIAIREEPPIAPKADPAT